MLIVVALAAAAISQGTGSNAPWDDRAPLAFATFREFREYLSPADSEVSIAGFIDNAPVIVSAKGWTRSREALRDACAALGLTYRYDAERNRSEIEVGPEAPNVGRRAEAIETALLKFREFVQPYLAMPANEVYRSSRMFLEMGANEPDAAERWSLFEKQEILSALAHSEGRAAIIAVLQHSPKSLSQILAAEYSRRNEVPMTPDSLEVANLVLSGRGVTVPDVIDRQSLTDAEWEQLVSIVGDIRSRHMSLNVGSPIVHFTHWVSPTMVSIQPRAVNPLQFGYLGSMTLRYTEKASVFTGQQLTADEASRRIKPIPLFKPFSYFTADSLGAIATEFDRPFIAWFEDQRFSPQSGEGRIGDYLKDSFLTGIKVVSVGEVRSVRDVSSMIPPSRQSAAPLVGVLRQWQVERPSWTALHSNLLKLSEVQLRDLENARSAWGGLPWEMNELISKARLLRIVLRELSPKAQDAMLAYKDLSPESRTDLANFLKSEFMWIENPCYFHPRATTKLSDLALRVKVESAGKESEIECTMTVPNREESARPTDVLLAIRIGKLE